MKKNEEKIKTPSQFYRQRRPENFSDSEIIWEYKLPKEVLSLELNNITTNQKENEFEILCRKLAEKLITPNLIPQVGPTGGGDGKTVSETHPVSSSISERWFVPALINHAAPQRRARGNAPRSCHHARARCATP